MANISAGSIWRKWDLHIHAPTAVFANEFEGKDIDDKWVKYIESIQNLDDIDVLGITDYWSLDGYKKVIEHEDQISNIKLILPNVEMRLSTFTPAGKAVNFHCIFNPEFIDQIDNRFFNKLVFNDGTEPFTCNHDSLIALGKKHTGNSELSDEAAYKEGCNQFKISHTDLITLFKDDPELRRNSFLIIPNSNQDGNSGIQDGSYEATR